MYTYDELKCESSLIEGVVFNDFGDVFTIHGEETPDLLFTVSNRGFGGVSVRVAGKADAFYPVSFRDFDTYVSSVMHGYLMGLRRVGRMIDEHKGGRDES